MQIERNLYTKKRKYREALKTQKSILASPCEGKLEMRAVELTQKQQTIPKTKLCRCRFSLTLWD